MGGVSDDVLHRPRVPQPGRRAGLYPAVDGGVRRTVRSRSRAASGPARPSATCSEACAPRAAHTDPYADLEAAQRRGIRLVVPESDEWPHFASVLSRGRRRAPGSPSTSDGQRRPADGGDPIPPLALWVRGDGRPGGARGAVGRHRRRPGRHALRRAGRRRPGPRAGRARVRRSCPAARTGSTPPRTAARWPPAAQTVVDLRRRARPRLPGLEHRAVRPGGRDRAAPVREPARRRPATAPVPDPQPADRRPVHRHGRGRGGGSLRAHATPPRTARRWADLSWPCPDLSPRPCRPAVTPCWRPRPRRARLVTSVADVVDVIGGPSDVTGTSAAGPRRAGIHAAIQPRLPRHHEPSGLRRPADPARGRRRRARRHHRANSCRGHARAAGAGDDRSGGGGRRRLPAQPVRAPPRRTRARRAGVTAGGHRR